MKYNVRQLGLLFAICIFSAMALGQVKQQGVKSLPSIKKLMSHDDFLKSGLAKLDDGEIKALDEWLQTYTVEIAKAVVGKNSPTTVGDVIETYIEGEFEGWEGDTIWKMDNGQIWQQASFAYHYHYAYHPKVLIYRASGVWKMRLDGTSDEVAVKRVK